MLYYVGYYVAILLVYTINIFLDYCSVPKRERIYSPISSPESGSASPEDNMSRLLEHYSDVFSPNYPTPDSTSPRASSPTSEYSDTPPDSPEEAPAQTPDRSPTPDYITAAMEIRARIAASANAPVYGPTLSEEEEGTEEQAKNTVHFNVPQGGIAALRKRLDQYVQQAGSRAVPGQGQSFENTQETALVIDDSDSEEGDLPPTPAKSRITVTSGPTAAPSDPRGQLTNAPYLSVSLRDISDLIDDSQIVVTNSTSSQGAAIATPAGEPSLAGSPAPAGGSTPSTPGASSPDGHISQFQGPPSSGHIPPSPASPSAPSQPSPAGTPADSPTPAPHSFRLGGTKRKLGKGPKGKDSGKAPKRKPTLLSQLLTGEVDIQPSTSLGARGGPTPAPPVPEQGISEPVSLSQHHCATVLLPCWGSGGTMFSLPQRVNLASPDKSPITPDQLTPIRPPVGVVFPTPAPGKTLFLWHQCDKICQAQPPYGPNTPPGYFAKHLVCPYKTTWWAIRRIFYPGIHKDVAYHWETPKGLATTMLKINRLFQALLVPNPHIITETLHLDFQVKRHPGLILIFTLQFRLRYFPEHQVYLQSFFCPMAEDPTIYKATLGALLEGIQQAVLAWISEKANALCAPSE